MIPSLYVRFLAIATGLLYLTVLHVLGQDVPHEEECTPGAISGCYLLYEHKLWDVELKQDHEDHWNNTAFDTACSAMQEKIRCHKNIPKCPSKAEIDVTRQEKGYKLLRDFVCDIELFKDFQRALQCKDDKKFEKCAPPPPKDREQPPYDPNGERCRITVLEWDCREESLHPDCDLPLNRAKAAYSKVRGALALLTGCDDKSPAAPSEEPSSMDRSSVAPSSVAPSSDAPSSVEPSTVVPSSVEAPTVAPLGLLLCLTTSSLLRWMYA